MPLTRLEKKISKDQGLFKADWWIRD
jgi:hypothetical protein